MDIQEAVKVNKLISDANIKLTGLICSGIFNSKDNICFYMDTFRRNNKLIPYLTFRHSNQKEHSNKIYRKFPRFLFLLSF